MRYISIIVSILWASYAAAQTPTQVLWGNQAGSPPSIVFKSGASWIPIGTYNGGIFSPVLPVLAPQSVDCNATGVTATATSCTTLPSGLTIPWTQSGTGAVERSIAVKLGEYVSLLDFGADPTGVVDSTAACNAAAATGKSVYVPDGTYKLTDICTLQNGQLMYGDGRTNSVFSVDAASFNMAALGILRLGTAEPGAQIMDIGITFVQPDTAVRANINAYPPALYANGAARFIIDRVRVSAGYECLDATGNTGGARIGVFECGALSADAGIEFNGQLDFAHIESIECWPFGITGTTNLYTSVYSDQTTNCMKIGLVDGLSIDKLAAFKTIIAVTTDQTSSIPIHIGSLQLDVDGARLSVESKFIQIGRMYSTKSASATSPIVYVKNATVVIDDYFSATDTSTICAAQVDTSGVLFINGGVIAHSDTASSAACIAGAATNAVLHIANVRAGLPASNRTAAFFDQSGATNAMKLVGVSSNVNGGSYTGNVFSFANDNSLNEVVGSYFPGWSHSIGFSTSTGYYDLAELDTISTVTPAFVTNGDFSPTINSSSGSFTRKGDFVQARVTVNFDTNAYTTAAGAFELLGTGVPTALSGQQYGCVMNDIGNVTSAAVQIWPIIQSQTFFIRAMASNAASVLLSQSHIPASKAGILLDFSCNYRVR